MNEVELETIYFAVVDTYDDLTGEPILNQAELLLDEDTYDKFLDYDDDKHVYIHWSEELEVIRTKANEYLLVNYTSMDGITHKDLYWRFKTKDLGNVEKFDKWLERKYDKGKDDDLERLKFLDKLLKIENELSTMEHLFRGNMNEYNYIRNLIYDLTDYFTKQEVKKVNEQEYI